MKYHFMPKQKSNF